jgi:hypothetical protein
MVKIFAKFDQKLHKTQKIAKKIRTRVSEEFLKPKVTTPQHLSRPKSLRV